MKCENILWWRFEWLALLENERFVEDWWKWI